MGAYPVRILDMAEALLRCPRSLQVLDPREGSDRAVLRQYALLKVAMPAKCMCRSSSRLLAPRCQGRRRRIKLHGCTEQVLAPWRPVACVGLALLDAMLALYIIKGQGSDESFQALRRITLHGCTGQVIAPRRPVACDTLERSQCERPRRDGEPQRCVDRETLYRSQCERPRSDGEPQRCVDRRTLERSQCVCPRRDGEPRRCVDRWCALLAAMLATCMLLQALVGSTYPARHQLSFPGPSSVRTVALVRRECGTPLSGTEFGCGDECASPILDKDHDGQKVNKLKAGPAAPGWFQCKLPRRDGESRCGVCRFKSTARRSCEVAFCDEHLWECRSEAARDLFDAEVEFEWEAGSKIPARLCESPRRCGETHRSDVDPMHEVRHSRAFRDSLTAGIYKKGSSNIPARRQWECPRRCEEPLRCDVCTLQLIQPNPRKGSNRAAYLQIGPYAVLTRPVQRFRHIRAFRDSLVAGVEHIATRKSLDLGERGCCGRPYFNVHEVQERPTSLGVSSSHVCSTGCDAIGITGVDVNPARGVGRFRVCRLGFVQFLGSTRGTEDDIQQNLNIQSAPPSDEAPRRGAGLYATLPSSRSEGPETSRMLVQNKRRSLRRRLNHDELYTAEAARLPLGAGANTNSSSRASCKTLSLPAGSISVGVPSDACQKINVSVARTVDVVFAEDDVERFVP